MTLAVGLVIEPLQAQQRLEPDPDDALWPRQHRRWLARRAPRTDSTPAARAPA